MNNASIIEMKLTATNETIARKDLSIDPRLQMRTEMNRDVIEEYAENIAVILELNPIEVVAVTMNDVEVWLTVDGFHRYHAALEANLEEIPVKMMQGTYELAVQYAMTANFKNGMRPSKADQARCIPMLLEFAPDFGYDSKAVNKWVRSFGIPKSTAENHTSAMIREIKDGRDAKVLKLHGEGMSQRKIAEEMGCAQRSVSNIIRELEQKTPEAQTAQTEAPLTSPSAHDSDFEEDDSPFFDEEDCDTTPAINPADAFNKVLEEHEAERKDSPTGEAEVNAVDSIKAVLKRSGIYEKLSKEEVKEALLAIAEAD